MAAKWKKVPSADVKKRSGDITNIFNSYSTNTHFLGTEQLVWIIGFEGRKGNKAEAEMQLTGHTKTYTKVVLNQTEEDLGTDQPAKAFVGKCVKVQVTSTHKWHIAGKIIDASPSPIEVGEDFFEKLALERKQNTISETIQ